MGGTAGAFVSTGSVARAAVATGSASGEFVSTLLVVSSGSVLPQEVRVGIRRSAAKISAKIRFILYSLRFVLHFTSESIAYWGQKTMISEILEHKCAGSSEKSCKTAGSVTVDYLPAVVIILQNMLRSCS